MDDSEAKRILSEAEHRPWPPPPEPWLIWQEWEDVGFANWRLRPDELRPHVPRELELDTFDDAAYLTLTPLRVRLRPHGLPLPGLSLDFAELNMRTYVRVGGRAGVFFFSLDAASRRAVGMARTFYRLPYHFARLSMDRSDGSILFRSRRESGDATFQARYSSAGEAREPSPESLEAWLVERYALFVVLRRRSVLRTDIHHRPWLLQPAQFRIEQNKVVTAAGIAVGDQTAAAFYARRQPVLTWGPRSASLP